MIGGSGLADAYFRLPAILITLCMTLPLLSLGVSSTEAGIDATYVDDERILSAFRSMDGYFIENRGQVSDIVRYYSEGNPSVAFRDDGVMFVLREQIKEEANAGEHQAFGPPSLTSANKRVVSDGVAYLVRFEGSNSIVPLGRDRLNFNSNFFSGNDTTDWQTDVPNYREIVYPNIYNGIDLVYRPSERGVKYEFIVSPGGNPSAITMRFEGIESLELESNEAIMSVSIGETRDTIPYSYQVGGSMIQCEFVGKGPYSYGFECAGVDAGKTLVIDPLVYSTYLGGSDDNEWCGIGQGDEGYAIAVDDLGHAYVYGGTCSLDFPVTPGAFNTTYWKVGQPVPMRCPDTWCHDDRQAFVAKLNPDGTDLVYATYFGGVRGEVPSDIAIDQQGNAFLTGVTWSAGLQPGTKPFPVTPGAFDTTFSVFLFWPVPSQWCWSIVFGEAFVTKLNAQGNGLIYSTFLGGIFSERASSIAIDAMGNAYVTGETNGSDFPITAGAWDPMLNLPFSIFDYTDAFITKINPTGTGLVYSTFVGGEGIDWATGIDIDSSGNAYIVGVTNSTFLPTKSGAYDRTFNGFLDSFVLKLNAAGSGMIYSTYLGSSGIEDGKSIVVDSSGSAIVVGETNSTDFPITPGVFDSWFIEDEGYITKINPTGTGLIFSSFIGGNSKIDRPRSVALDHLDNIYVTGNTYSFDFPITKDAFDTQYDDMEGFFCKINPTATTLLYSSFLGGESHYDRGMAVAVDPYGIAYVTGYTASPDFPVTPGAFDTTLNNISQADAFVVKWNPVFPTDPPDLVITDVDISFNPPSPVWVGDPVIITAVVRNIGGTNVSNVAVRFFDGPPGGGNQIGTDQSIPFIERYFGKENASVLWTAGPVGLHDIYVVVDPNDVVSEVREDNNQASAPIEVLPLQPDLEVQTSDILVSPAPPYQLGTSVQIDARIWNVGQTGSAATIARFHDGVPPAPQIGSDRPVGVLPVGGSTVVSATWTAQPPGFHTLCVNVDPNDIIVEMYETNNLACLSVQVLTPTDLTPTNFIYSPSSPMLLGTTVFINTTIANWGEVGAGPFDVMLFNDVNSNSVPDGGESIDVSPQTGLPARWQIKVSFTWTATPAGTYRLCSYADPPPGTVSESNENNNVRCVQIVVQQQVVLKPDYVPTEPVPDTMVTVDPLSSVDLSINVTNQGNGTANRTSSLAFYNESTPSVPFTTASVLPIPSGVTAGPYPATWYSPSTPGTYRVVADVDYYDDNEEWNETNNLHSWTIVVQSGPVLKPDYVPTQPDPSMPMRVGLSTPVQISICILNQGNATASEQSTLAFLDSTSPTPFLTYPVPPLDVSMISSRFSAIWTSPAVPGTYQVMAVADYDDNLTEWNEMNNLFAWTVEVVSGPITSLVIGSPNYTGAAIYVRSFTPFALSVVDQSKAGINCTMYQIDGGGWADYLVTGIFYMPGEGAHTVEFYSEDNAGNVEEVRTATIYVDDTPPVTTLSIGDPKHLVGSNFVTSRTPLDLSAQDGGSTPVGIDRIEYQVDGGIWMLYSSSFGLSGEGMHTLRYRAFDLLANEETPTMIQLIVDDTPPQNTIGVGSPKFTLGTVYVRSTTMFGLNAIDRGVVPVGLDTFEYRIDNGQWLAYSLDFNLDAGDGFHEIEYRSSDLLGNSGTVESLVVYVDDTPPATSITPNIAEFTIDTVFTLAATDGGSGVCITRFKVDDGDWTEYTDGFTLPVGNHTIRYRSTDNLGNEEMENVLTTNVTGPIITIPPEAEINYKPLVALVFSILLAVFGFWSSKRKPWKGGKDKWAVVKSFLLVSLPFVIAETVTGATSLVLGGLAIPPVLGPGLAVDVAILVAGLILAFLWRARTMANIEPPDHSGADQF